LLLYCGFHWKLRTYTLQLLLWSFEIRVLTQCRCCWVQCCHFWCFNIRSDDLREISHVWCFGNKSDV